MQALILAGGSGTRFWPLSRRSRPKQLLALDGDTSLLRATVERLAPEIPASSVWISTTAALADAIRAELPEVPDTQILVEPVGRNTAPAIGYAVRMMPEIVRRGVVAVLPADHRVEDGAAFRRVLLAAGRAAAEIGDDGSSRILTLGIKPHRVETGYGYLEVGSSLDSSIAGLRRVARFTEKPDLETAERWTADGQHLWNAGIFVFRGQTLLDALAEHEPEIGRGLEAIAAEPEATDRLYRALPKVSIDYGVMERQDDLATLPLDCGWSDLGSWQALSEITAPDADGNALRGDVTAVDSRDSLVIADQGHVAIIGVEGLAVIRTGDTVLVMPKSRSQDVRAVVDALQAKDRNELL